MRTEDASWLVGVVGAFLIGAIPFAWILGRALGLDLRRVGSGNPGATNLGRSTRPAWGVIAFLLDAGKGAAAVALLFLWGPEVARGWPFVAVSGAAIAGHCYSPLLGFRGGKGVATAAGVLLAYAPVTFAGLAAVWLLSLLGVRSIGIASSVAAVAAGVLGCDAVWFGGRLLGGEGPAFGTLLIGLSLLVLQRHRTNLREFMQQRGVTRR